MRKLTREQIIILHELLLKYSGGSDGIRDIGMLESALEAPFITFADISNYPL
ncbi:MAG: cell filamentation protein Fic [Lachnospiraceae bacterium]|nr:cell filamentation protein Fic [Lachnospiraceae bacterium]